MRGRPVIEILLVVGLLCFGVWMICSLPRGVAVQLSVQDEGGSRHLHEAMVELRFADEPDSFLVELRDGSNRWREVMRSAGGVAQDFASVDVWMDEEAPELRVRVLWPESVEESVAELRWQLGEDEPALRNLWGSGEIEEVFTFESHEHRH